ncbi:hypothetical protein [Hymenobacter rigui]|uniref:Uncharacterized protein n=1 Tax=Hymenobacter rigui TaxID=334424 RepID=A0A3R9MU54_9BACT|nr:hypothetical protein [Hymenobacter rigui]RSK50167.1 hypothetical protein EI291_05805 [Hymenobacter rigui]
MTVFNMTENSTLLLNYYTREQRALAKQLREALQEQDYRLAARIQKGQHLVKHQIHLLQLLQNKHADELEQVDRWIRFLQRAITAKQEPHGLHHEMLLNYEQQRQKLLDAASSPPTNTSVLQELMKQLLAGDLAAFTLVLSKSTRLCLSIRRVRRTLILTLPELIRHRQESTIRPVHLRRLRNLGFTYYDHKDKLLAFQPLATAEDLAHSMQLLMKITCLVFDFQDLHNDTEVRYFSA